MSLVTDVLSVLSDAETLLDGMGFKPFTVTMRVVSWSGGRTGAGTRTVTDTPLTNDGTTRLNVVRIKDYELVAAGGKYQEGDYRIGPFTPPFDGGGNTPAVFYPAAPNVQEILYCLTGPGFESGTWFRKIDIETDDPFGYFLTVRALNTVQL